MTKEQLCEQHILLAYRLAHDHAKKTGADVEECIAEALYVLWTCCLRHNEAARFSTYFTTVCKKRLWGAPNKRGECPKKASECYSPQDNTQVNEFLNSLPQPEKGLCAAIISGYTCAEIALVSGRSKQAVHSRLRKLQRKAERFLGAV